MIEDIRFKQRNLRGDFSLQVKIGGVWQEPRFEPLTAEEIDHLAEQTVVQEDENE